MRFEGSILLLVDYNLYLHSPRVLRSNLLGWALRILRHHTYILPRSHHRLCIVHIFLQHLSILVRFEGSIRLFVGYSQTYSLDDFHILILVLLHLHLLVLRIHCYRHILSLHSIHHHLNNVVLL